MKKGYILAHDLGTSGNKATLYDQNGNLCASTLCEYKTLYIKASWIEQDPDDWWNAICKSTKQLIELAKISKDEILCITFSAQMMGCLPVDNDGNALRNSIIWADTRATIEAEFIENVVGTKNMYGITGHRVSSSYSAAKILWIKNNQPDIYNNTYKILNAKDYIAHKITGNFVTDYSDACGMNLFDLEKKKWSDEIISEIKLKNDILPEAHASTDIIGTVLKGISDEIGLLEGTPVVIGGGDGSCAAVGAGVVEAGSAYNVIGSSSWIAVATEKPIYDPNMKTFNWVHLDQNLYSPCGTMQSAGFSMSWLKDTICGLEIVLAKEQNISPYELINQKIACSIPGANNLLFLPYLLGERSPRWNPNAKAAFIGLNMEHTNSDIYRSVLEGVVFNLKVILDVFDNFDPIDKVTVIGGGARSKVWLQILSDIWQKPVLVPKYLEEATSLGAAVCGGVGIELFSDFKVAKKFNNIVEEIKPRTEYKEIYEKLYKIFNDSYSALMPIYESLSKL